MTTLINGCWETIGTGAAGTTWVYPVIGSDGNIWASSDASIIGRFTMAGVETDFATTGANFSGNAPIINGPDGNIWVLSQNTMDTFDTSGTILNTATLPTVLPNATMIGSANYVWVCGDGGSSFINFFSQYDMAFGVTNYTSASFPALPGGSATTIFNSMLIGSDGGSVYVFVNGQDTVGDFQAIYQVTESGVFTLLQYWRTPSVAPFTLSQTGLWDGSKFWLVGPNPVFYTMDTSGVVTTYTLASTYQVFAIAPSLDGSKVWMSGFATATSTRDDALKFDVSDPTTIEEIVTNNDPLSSYQTVVMGPDGWLWEPGLPMFHQIRCSGGGIVMLV